MPILLAFGVVGCALKINLLKIFGKVGAWAFMLLVIRDAIPDPDDYFVAGKNVPSGAFGLIRIVLLAGTAISIIALLQIHRFQFKSSPDAKRQG